MITEADTCRKYVLPKLQGAGWEHEPHSLAEQRHFTDGHILVVGGKSAHGTRKRADYLLPYTRDFPIAVVEAKAAWDQPASGIQQAKVFYDGGAAEMATQIELHLDVDGRSVALGQSHRQEGR